jgi:hypothetical protein
MHIALRHGFDNLDTSEANQMRRTYLQIGKILESSYTGPPRAR